jgi:hypothetical protein
MPSTGTTMPSTGTAAGTAAGTTMPSTGTSTGATMRRRLMTSTGDMGTAAGMYDTSMMTSILGDNTGGKFVKNAADIDFNMTDPEALKTQMQGMLE